MGQWEEALCWIQGHILCSKERNNAFPTAYKDLQSREETRNAAWRKRGWDENVYYTGEHLLWGLSGILGGHVLGALSEDRISSARRASFT